MKKLTRKNLDELAKMMPVISEIEQRRFVGGGNGSYESPYTVAEYDRMCDNGTWHGGYVQGWGYTYSDVVVTGISGGGTYNVNNAVNYLTSHAHSSSTGYCARSVRMALEAGGISTDGRPNSACGYDTWLTSVGFSAVSPSGGYTPQPGDIVVFEAINGHPHGHIAMYNGQEWVSDFVQSNMYGSSSYRTASYTILRHY